MKKISLQFLLLSALLIYGFNGHASGQAELQAWGNMSGIRIDGQLMKFETSLQVVMDDWNRVISTGKERQRRPIYQRESDRQVVMTSIDDLSITTVVKDVPYDAATVDVKIESRADTSYNGIFFCVKVPVDEYAGGNIQLIDPSDVSLEKSIPSTSNEILRMNAKGFHLIGKECQLEVYFQEQAYMIVRSQDNSISVLLEMASGPVRNGQVLEKSYTIRASGKVNNTPVHIVV